ncbi:MAG: tetratricopeptide repeat protein [Gammaproteobacteria bacterium]|nr:tetratricopeptide repeat protein [Gammaproteobacteria bacterium]
MNTDPVAAQLNSLTQQMLRGELGAVEDGCIDLLRRIPPDPRVLCLLGRVQRLQRKLGPARKSLEQAAQLAPRAAQVMSELGYLAVAEENYVAAESHFASLSRARPQLADAWFNLGVARRQQGKHESAIDALEQALSHGQAQREQILTELGTVHIMQRQEQQALDYFEQALALVPDYAPALYGVGMVRSAFGEFDDAADYFRQALSSDPDFVEAYQQLVSIQRYDDVNDPEVQQMAAAATDPARAAATREALHFALGKVCDDAGEYQRAFGHFTEANELKKTRMPQFSRTTFSQFIDNLIASFSSSPKLSWHSDSQLPILVFGMPRSGTTLVEQVIASHSKVSAGGEQSYIDRASRTRLAPYPQGLAGQPAATLQAFTREYERLLSQYRDPGIEHVTDKLPANFLHAGLVHALFPNARLVYCRRNRLDNLLSIFFQSMPIGHYYANDLHDIDFYYREHLRLTTHWQQVLGERLLTIDYETLTSDFDNQVKRLIEHCGLPWESQCLDYRARRGPVATLSLWQVRQPIYSRSVNRWQNYADLLPPDLLDKTNKP